MTLPNKKIIHVKECDVCDTNVFIVWITYVSFRFGKVLIIQEVDNIDPVLFPILRGDFINQGKKMRNGLWLFTRFLNVIYYVSFHN